jgi:hypothetical protein
MSDDITKDDLKSELEDLQHRPTMEVTSSVVTISQDMTDGRGNLIDEKIPDVDPPEGFELGNEVPTQSSVCVWHKLTSIDE